MSIINNLIDTLNTYKKYRLENISQKKESVRFFNWFEGDVMYWFRDFINQNEILKDSKKTIAFFTVFGRKLPLYLNRSNVKVFFTGENIHRNEFKHDYTHYENYGLECGIDLALGFDYKHDNRNYLRFPLWMCYEFLPKINAKEIKTVCDGLSHHILNKSLEFCSLVSRHDPNGLRKEIYDKLSKLDTISCGGSFLNNTNELESVHKNDKVEYLKQFKFNICPENTNTEGYVTEKIFQAVKSGAIPVYWGSNNNPEPEILNKDAIIFWSKGGDNSKAIQLIEELNQSPKLYKEFYEQPRLLPHADQIIAEMMFSLEQKLKKILKNT